MKNKAVLQHKPPTPEKPAAEPRKALPGHAKQDKHPVIKRGEPITQDTLLTKWTPR